MSFQYVSGPQGPESLVDFLARRFGYHSGSEWRDLIMEGHVTLNGERTAPRTRLRTRDKIVYNRPPLPEPEVNPNFRVVYEDDALLAVDKPGNLPTSPSGKYWNNCLIHIAKQTLDMPELYVCHRLDRETSGLNLLAKTREAARDLSDDFRTGKVEKRYAAVLRGWMQPPQIYCSVPLGRDLASGVRIRQGPRRDGRPARTRFRLLARLPQSSLVEVQTFTGRTHQIRAHAAWVGHPIWHDKLYGQSDQAFVDWLERPRGPDEPSHLLHATDLRFVHPVSGNSVHLSAPARELVPRLIVSLNSEEPASPATT